MELRQQQTTGKEEKAANEVFTGTLSSCDTCFDKMACPNPLKFLFIACGRYSPQSVYFSSRNDD